MGFKSDIEIAQEAKPLDIREVGKKLGLTEDDLELYGKYKAKVDYNLLKKETGKKEQSNYIIENNGDYLSLENAVSDIILKLHF